MGKNGNKYAKMMNGSMMNGSMTTVRSASDGVCGMLLDTSVEVM